MIICFVRQKIKLFSSLLCTNDVPGMGAGVVMYSNRAGTAPTQSVWTKNDSSQVNTESKKSSTLEADLGNPTEGIIHLLQFKEDLSNIQ